MTTVTDLLWAQMPEPVFITRGEFEQALADWEIEPIEADGQIVFATLTKGPEFHFASFAGKPISLTLVRAWVAPIVERYGYALTRTPKNDRRQQRFNVRLGCRIVGEDEFFLHYKLGATTCQS